MTFLNVIQIYQDYSVPIYLVLLSKICSSHIETPDEDSSVIVQFNRSTS